MKTEEIKYLLSKDKRVEDMVGKRPKISAEEHDIINSKINELVS